MSLSTIVLSGGGAKGFTYLGILKFLEEENRIEQVHRVIGVSIGAIFAVLIAQKQTYENVCEILIKYSMPQINETNLWITLFKLYKSQACYTGDKLKNLVHSLIGNITFKELQNQSGIEVTIVACNITKHICEYFNYKSFPNMPIHIAVLASTAFPFVFSPITYDNSLYVDGGILNNIPHEYYTDDGICFILEEGAYDDGLPPRVSSTSDTREGGSDDIIEYIKDIYKTLVIKKEKIITDKKIAVIPYTGIHTFDLNLSNDLLNKLMAVGYQTIGMVYMNLTVEEHQEEEEDALKRSICL